MSDANINELGQPLGRAEMRLDDQAIAEYLLENPNFFDDHPELLSALQVRHQARGAVSLVERQQQVLREKIVHLEEEITALMGNARRNERIFQSYSILYQALLQCTDIIQVERALVATFVDDLGLTAHSLKLFVPTPHKHLAFDADTHKQLLRKRFEKAAVYFGRLPEAEHKLLFPTNEAVAQIESVALLLLEQESVNAEESAPTNKRQFALLALGSQDPAHFEPNMDHLLISQLQALLSHMLPPLVK